MRKIVLLLSYVFFTAGFYAQSVISDTSSFPYWIDMMQDPKANFFETQKAFEKYWVNRERDKGDGWKPFKRWEYFTEQRIDVNGNKPAPEHVLNEYQSYFLSNSKSDQLVEKDHWKEVGPILMPVNGTGQPNGLGRVNCLAFHPSNSDLFYAGAPAGGLWKTSNGGNNWEILTDTLPTLGVSSIVVDFSSPNTIYLGTGDRDSDDAPGLGVWKSTDGGLTWKSSNTGMGNRVVGKMIMNPQNNAELLAATSGGIYKSVDNGQSWSRKSSVTSHFKDIVYKPGDPSIVYATSNGSFFRSSNAGDTWAVVTNGLPTSNRLVIGVTPANSNYVYLLLSNQRTFKGLYQSTDSGVSFNLMSNSPNILDYKADGSGTSGQAWYDLCIAVDPLNANILYAGGINIWKSIDGGINWTLSAHWTFGPPVDDVHADQHELVYSPSNGRLYNGNDGGIYYTQDGGSNWTEISSGLGISQIYKIGQSAQADKLVINGYQDNGTSVYDGSWRTEIGGDGMECIIDPTDSNYMYGALYYGDIRRSTNKGYNFSKITDSITESGSWVTPYILKEGNADVMIAGFKNLWRSSNIKASPTSAIVWEQISTNASGSNTIRVLESSPANPDILYFSRSDNTFFRSDNISAASPTYTSLTGLPINSWPKDIEAHPTNANKVYIVVSNSVFESNNKGVSWTDISGSLPNVSMNCIVFDASSNGDLYVGCDLGVFFKGAWMTDWVPFTDGMPVTAEVTELEIFYSPVKSKSRIKASTYGRGLWSSPLYQKIEPYFESNKTQICVGQTVQYSDLSNGFYTDVHWDFPGGTPSSSNLANPVVKYNSTGTFKVSLKLSNAYEEDSITDPTYMTVDPCTGNNIFEFAGGSLQIYPNPSENKTRIIYSGISGNSLLVSMHDVNGKSVFNKQFNTTGGNGEISIATNEMKAGLYLVGIETSTENSERVVLKLMVNH